MYQVRTVAVSVSPQCLPGAPLSDRRELTAALFKAIGRKFPDAKIFALKDVAREANCLDVRIVLANGQDVDPNRANQWRGELFDLFAAALHQAWSGPPSIGEEPDQSLPHTIMDVTVTWDKGVLTGGYRVV